ncbi:MAG TPA: cupin domain-containing protein [Gaiellaceae bacterium]|nr:cupin domain-containing protein [Gaiellaceae bacterium]
MSELRHFPGSEQTIEILLDAAATGGALALMTLRMPPGAGAPPHRHHCEAETLLVREGELWVELGGEERTLAAGEAVFLPQGSLHAFRSAGGAVVDVIASPAGLEEFFRVLCSEDPDAPPPPDAEVAAVTERLGLDFSGR